MSHIDELEKSFHGKELFASKEQRKIVEIFAAQGYKTFGGTEDNGILMQYKHSTGEFTKIFIDKDGNWSKVNFED